MTEANMKKLYEYFIKSGQTARAEEIVNIKGNKKNPTPYRYFAETPKEEPVKEAPKSKGKK